MKELTLRQILEQYGEMPVITWVDKLNRTVSTRDPIEVEKAIKKGIVNYYIDDEPMQIL